MNDADKIKYLEGWVERLVEEKHTLKYQLGMKERSVQEYIEQFEGAIARNREHQERIRQLETELADAKALAHQQAAIAPTLAKCDEALAGLRDMADNLEAEIVKAETSDTTSPT